MKLSAFEILSRRMASEKDIKKINLEEQPITTEHIELIPTTKQLYIGKYKPIISKLKRNYLKRKVTPVKSKVITL